MSYLEILLEEFDFSHIPKEESSENKPTTELSSEMSNFDFSYVQSDAPEQTEKRGRLLGIDKEKINKELKTLSETPMLKAIPLSKVKEILAKYKVSIKEEQIKFKGNNGDAEYNLVQKGKLITNTKIVFYWKKENDLIKINIYLS